MTKKVLILLLACFSVHHTLKADEGVPASVAVLPFEVFALKEQPALGRDIAVKLTQELTANPYVGAPAFDTVLSVIRDDDVKSLTMDRLKEIAKLLEVNFIVFGSITTIQDESSIDAQLFDALTSEAYFKTFAEGGDLDEVVADLARQVEPEIAQRSAFIPPAQRPDLAKAPQAQEADEAGAQELVDEITRELGLEGQPEEQPLPTPETLQEVRVSQRPVAAVSEDVPPPEKAPVAGVPPEVSGPPSGEVPGPPSGEAPGPPSSDEARGRDKPLAGLGPGMQGPVNITSDSLEYDNRRSRVVFKGNVVARQSDIVMYADEMKVQYTDKGGLREILALGNVRVVRGDWIGTGSRIVFNNDRQTITVTGSPRVWQGDNVVQGRKIIFYLQEDRSVVEGTPGERVSATILPDQGKQRKPAKAIGP